MDLLTAPDLPSPLLDPALTPRPHLRVGLVQMRWLADPERHRGELAEGIGQAAAAGAQVVFLPELTLRRYPADTPATGVPKLAAESLVDGPTVGFAREQAARHGVLVHASLFERPAADDDPEDPRGYNTAVLVDPAGALLGATRKTHIPVTTGYFEDTWFRAGGGEDPFPVVEPPGLGARLGLPTCWDEWFPELARSYSLAGAQVLAYPTAIGSEPGFPDFDTAGIWRHVVVANAITSGMFVVVPNRCGTEGDISFYGSSFVADPFGRVLVEAPRDRPAVLVADLDLAQRAEWLRRFPFLLTRRPDLYGGLTAPVDPQRHGFGTPAEVRAAVAAHGGR